MKQLLLIVVLGCSLSSNAQIKKGKVGMSAGISVQTSKTEGSGTTFNQPADETTNKASNINVTYGVGTFISDKVFLGIRFGYGKQTQEQPYQSSTDKAVIETIPIGLEMKWYKKLGGNFYYNLNINADYTHISGKETFTPAGGGGSTDEATAKGDAYKVRVSPLQITYALSKRFLVEAGFAYIEYGWGKTAYSYANGAGGNNVQNKKLSAFNMNLSPVTSSFTFTYLLGK